MAAVAAQQGLGQDNGLSMPFRLCLGGPSQSTQIKCCCSSASSKGPPYWSQAVPALGLLQSQQDHATKSAIELVFRAEG